MRGNITADSQWEIDRLGKFTSSEINRLLAPLTKSDNDEKNVLPKGARTYVYEKVAELLTGTMRQETNFALEWGIQWEPAAAELIEKLYPDLIYHGLNLKKFYKYGKQAGGSPDAVSKAKKSVFEIKCPENPANHIQYLLLKTQQDLNRVHSDYYCQIQMNMMCTAVDLECSFTEMTGYFVSFCPIILDEYKDRQLLMLKVTPDVPLMTQITSRIKTAEEYLSTIIKTLC